MSFFGLFFRFFFHIDSSYSRKDDEYNQRCVWKIAVVDEIVAFLEDDEAFILVEVVLNVEGFQLIVAGWEAKSVERTNGCLGDSY